MYFAWSFCIKLVSHQLTVILGLVSTRAIFWEINILENRSRQQAAARRTEKADVYSFGIVLLELLTRKKARYDGNHSLPLDYVKASMGGAVREMFNPEVASHGKQNEECLEEVGKIAVQCLKEDVNDRPTMNEVAERLKICKCRWLEYDRKTNEICT